MSNMGPSYTELLPLYELVSGNDVTIIPVNSTASINSIIATSDKGHGLNVNDIQIEIYVLNRVEPAAKSYYLSFDKLNIQFSSVKPTKSTDGKFTIFKFKLANK